MRVAQRWLAEGCHVTAITRADHRATEFRQQGIEPLVSDVLRVTSLPRLDTYQTILFAVGYDRKSPASMRDVYVSGLRNVLQCLETSANPSQRFIYISSTGVYGDSDGEWIDENTPCHPEREGGRVCWEAEQQLANSDTGPRSIVLRMAGIYGPGRIPRKQELLTGKPIAVPPQGSLNLIHVDDAAEVVLAAERFASLPNLYVVSDGEPVERRDYFRVMAQLLGAPPPQFEIPADDSPAAARAQLDKRINSAKMMSDLHVALRYPSYREGLAAIISAEG